MLGVGAMFSQSDGALSLRRRGADGGGRGVLASSLRPDGPAASPHHRLSALHQEPPDPAHPPIPAGRAAPPLRRAARPQPLPQPQDGRQVGAAAEVRPAPNPAHLPWGDSPGPTPR